MSYMPMTIYNIYHFYLLLSIYSVCMIIYLLKLYVGIGYSTNYFHQYTFYHTCYNASVKLIMVWFVHTKFCKQ